MENTIFEYQGRRFVKSESGNRIHEVVKPKQDGGIYVFVKTDKTDSGFSMVSEYSDYKYATKLEFVDACVNSKIDFNPENPKLFIRNVNCEFSQINICYIKDYENAIVMNIPISECDIKFKIGDSVLDLHNPQCLDYYDNQMNGNIVSINDKSILIEYPNGRLYEYFTTVAYERLVLSEIPDTFQVAKSKYKDFDLLKTFFVVQDFEQVKKFFYYFYPDLYKRESENDFLASNIAFSSCKAKLDSSQNGTPWTPGVPELPKLMIVNTGNQNQIKHLFSFVSNEYILKTFGSGFRYVNVCSVLSDLEKQVTCNDILYKDKIDFIRNTKLTAIWLCIDKIPKETKLDKETESFILEHFDDICQNLNVSIDTAFLQIDEKQHTLDKLKKELGITESLLKYHEEQSYICWNVNDILKYRNKQTEIQTDIDKCKNEIQSLVDILFEFTNEKY
jgi:hypothetical protein